MASPSFSIFKNVNGLALWQTLTNSPAPFCGLRVVRHGWDFYIFSIVIVLINNIMEQFEETNSRMEWCCCTGPSRGGVTPVFIKPQLCHLSSAAPFPALTNNYVFYLEKFYSRHIQKWCIINCWPPEFRGRLYLYICVHMYLQYIFLFFFFSFFEFVFVFGSMTIRAGNQFQPARFIWLKTL